MESGRWSRPLASLRGVQLSARSAIAQWYASASPSSRGFRFFDTCQGPYCNDMCPDEFLLGELTSNNWPLWAKLVIACSVVLIAMVCLVMKTLFAVWLYRLESGQDAYLQSLDDNPEDEAALAVRRLCN